MTHRTKRTTTYPAADLRTDAKLGLFAVTSERVHDRRAGMDTGETERNTIVQKVQGIQLVERCCEVEQVLGLTLHPEILPLLLEPQRKSRIVTTRWLAKLP